jgi:hypothetical protein
VGNRRGSQGKRQRPRNCLCVSHCRLRRRSERESLLEHNSIFQIKSELAQRKCKHRATFHK